VNRHPELTSFRVGPAPNVDQPDFERDTNDFTHLRSNLPVTFRCRLLVIVRRRLTSSLLIRGGHAYHPPTLGVQRGNLQGQCEFSERRHSLLAQMTLCGPKIEFAQCDGRNAHLTDGLAAQLQPTASTYWITSRNSSTDRTRAMSYATAYVQPILKECRSDRERRLRNDCR
jgi:hypothetical protein